MDAKSKRVLDRFCKKTFREKYQKKGGAMEEIFREFVRPEMEGMRGGSMTGGKIMDFLLKKIGDFIKYLGKDLMEKIPKRR